MKRLHLFVLVIGCMSCQTKTNVCEIKSLKMLGTHEIVLDKSTGVEHYILIEDFPRSCLDSAVIVNAAANYIDTVGKSGHEIAMPANVLRFYSSDNNFLLDKASENKQLNRSCLVAIIIGYYNDPNKYIFYNDNGEVVYSGNKWLR